MTRPLARRKMQRVRNSPSAAPLVVVHAEGTREARARRVGQPMRPARKRRVHWGATYCADRWFANRSANVVSTLASARGALSARPVARLSPRRPRCPSISARGRGFVIRSAGFSVPNTLCRRHACDRTRSCTHSCATARWRTCRYQYGGICRLPRSCRHGLRDGAQSLSRARRSGGLVPR